MNLIAFLAGGAILSAYSGPQPEEVKQYRDWVVSCDNARYCEAVGLDPFGKGPLEVTITNSVHDAVGAQVSIVHHGKDQDFRLFLDGQPLPNGGATAGVVRYQGDSAKQIARRLAEGHYLTARDRSGQKISAASIFGVKAALLYMDDRQERSGTTGAIIKTGSKSVSEILPGWSTTLTLSAAGREKPTNVPKSVTDKLLVATNCDSHIDTPADDFAISRLDEESTLLILPNICLSGAYNLASQAYVVSNSGEYRAAEFDIDPGMGGDNASNWVANVLWDEQGATLETSVLTRSLGDCGRRRYFIWNGESFNLFKQEDMPVCGGRTRFVRTFTAGYAARESR